MTQANIVTLATSSSEGNEGKRNRKTQILSALLSASALGVFLEGCGGGDTAAGGGGGAPTPAVLGSESNPRLATAGADSFTGTPGADWVSYADSDAGVTITLGEDGIASAEGVGGFAAGDTLTDINNLIGSDYADTLTGNSNDNTFRGGLGGDTLDGGDGADEVSYSNSANGVRVDLTIAGAQLDFVANSFGFAETQGGDAVGDIISNVENILGSNHGDWLTGDENANRLLGGAGNDRLEGGADADTLEGGAGDDTLIGGEEGDTLDGGAGEDTASYAGSTAVTIDLADNGAATTGSDGWADGDTLRYIENLIGSGGDDRLTGNNLANILRGEDGNDRLEGGAGEDTLNGGAGADWAYYSRSSKGVRVDLTLTGEQRDFDGTEGFTANDNEAVGDIISNIENILGSGYNDWLTGDTNANTLRGEGGNDRLEGGEDDDILNGGTGADILNGGDGEDTLDGGTGADILNGGDGEDTLDGGAGAEDTASYAGSDAAVTITLGADGVETTGSGGHAAGDTLTNIENLIGSNHADRLTGNNLANTLRGGGEADTLNGGDGADTLSYEGSDAAVTITLGADGVETTGSGGHAAGDKIENIENLIGSDHADRLTGNNLANVLRGALGGDTLDGGDGADVLEGGAGDDTLIGGAQGDTLDGGEGEDTLSYAGSDAAVTITLGAGGALTTGSGGHAVGDTLRNIENLIGSGEDDRLTGNNLANTLRGAEGDDRLYGGAADDTLYGDEGADTLVGGDGEDTLDGGAGAEDTASYAGSNAAVTIALLDNGALTTGSGGHADGDTLRNIENLIGSNHADRLTGNNLANTLRGEGGNDRLEGGDGGDTIKGGAGEDTLSYEGSDAAVTITLGADGVETTGSGGHAAGDTLTNIENLTGSGFGDTLTGNNLANTLRGGLGADILNGGAGDDTLIGGAQGDTLDGGEGADTLSYEGSDAAVTIDLLDNGALTTGSGGHAESDTLTNIENLIGSDHADRLTGNNLANTLRGALGGDTLNGGDGADVLEGGAGDDILIGGAQGDTLDGGEGEDTLSYEGSDAAVTIDLADNGGETTGSGGHAAGDKLRNIENLIGSGFVDTLTGNNLANTLRGALGADTLSGGAGDDTLIGGAGDDTLDGGTQGDTLDGGDGTADEVSYSNSAQGVMVDLTLTGEQRDFDGTEGFTANDNEAVGDIISNIENIVGSDYNDWLMGNDDANTLLGGAGDDTLNGGADGDTYLFNMGDGTDTILSASDGLNNTLIFRTTGTNYATADLAFARGTLADPSAGGDFTIGTTAGNNDLQIVVKGDTSNFAVFDNKVFIKDYFITNDVEAYTIFVNGTGDGSEVVGLLETELPTT